MSLLLSNQSQESLDLISLEKQSSVQIQQTNNEDVELIEIKENVSVSPVKSILKSPQKLQNQCFYLLNFTESNEIGAVKKNLFNIKDKAITLQIQPKKNSSTFDLKSIIKNQSNQGNRKSLPSLTFFESSDTLDIEDLKSKPSKSIQLKVLSKQEVEKLKSIWQNGLSFLVCLQNLKNYQRHNHQIDLQNCSYYDLNFKKYKPLFSIYGHQEGVMSVDFCPKTSKLVTGGADCNVIIWQKDKNSDYESSILNGHTDCVNQVCFSPDGSKIVSASDDKSIKIWDSMKQQLLKTLLSHEDAVNSVSFSVDGKLIFSVSKDDTMKIWDDKYQLIKTLNNHKDIVTSLAISNDGCFIATTSEDGQVIIYDQEFSVVKILTEQTGGRNSISFSYDSHKLASIQNGQVQIWNMKSFQIQHKFGKNVNTVIFSACKFAISVMMDQLEAYVQIFDQSNFLLIQSFELLSGAIFQLKFSQDGRLLATGNADNSVKIFKVAGKRQKCLFEDHKERINSVDISRDNSILITASDDCSVKIWDLESQKLLHTIVDSHQDDVNFVKFSPDGNIFVTASEDFTIKVWDSQNYQLLYKLEDHTETVNGIEFSIDGKYMISCGDDSYVKIWDIQKQFKIIHNLKDDQNQMIKSVQFSNDGLIFGTSSDKLVKIYNSKTFQILTILDGHTSFSFSPDGTKISALFGKNQIKLWDLQTFYHFCTLSHDANVVKTMFSPDGRILATACKNSIKLWNSDTFELFDTIKYDKITTLEFSQFGLSMVVGSQLNQANLIQSYHTEFNFFTFIQQILNANPVQIKEIAKYINDIRFEKNLNVLEITILSKEQFILNDLVMTLQKYDIKMHICNGSNDEIFVNLIQNFQKLIQNNLINYILKQNIAEKQCKFCIQQQKFIEYCCEQKSVDNLFFDSLIQTYSFNTVHLKKDKYFLELHNKYSVFFPQELMIRKVEQKLDAQNQFDEKSKNSRLFRQFDHYFNNNKSKILNDEIQEPPKSQLKIFQIMLQNQMQKIDNKQSLNQIGYIHFIQINYLLQLILKISDSDINDSDDILSSQILTAAANYYYQQYVKRIMMMEFFINFSSIIMFICYVLLFQNNHYLESYQSANQTIYINYVCVILGIIEILLELYQLSKLFLKINIFISSFKCKIFKEIYDYIKRSKYTRHYPIISILITISNIIAKNYQPVINILIEILKSEYFDIDNCAQMLGYFGKLIFLFYDQKMYNEYDKDTSEFNQNFVVYVVILNLMSMFQFLEIFEKFSVISTMLVKTISSLVGFLQFLAFFTFSAFIIYNQIQVLGIFLNKNEVRTKYYMFRATVMTLFGQYDDIFFTKDSVSFQDENTYLNILLFFSFFWILIVLNIILMNILIAIVGQKFDDVLSTQEKVSIYNVIKRCSKIMKKYEVLNVLPALHYLIVVDQNQSLESDKSSQSEDFSSIRALVKEQNEKLKQDFNQKIDQTHEFIEHEMQQSIKIINQKIDDQFNELRKLIINNQPK